MTNEERGRLIRRHREQLGLSQDKVAERLELNRVSYSQIERGRRKINADELVNLSNVLNISTSIILGLRKEDEVAVQHEERKAAASPDYRISVPQKKMDVFREILLYLIGKVGSRPHVGETVLYKLLYFVDFNYYEKYEEQLIGATYLKNSHGPTPREFKKLIEQMSKAKEVMVVDSKYFCYPQRKYLPLREPDLSGIGAQAMEVIDAVLANLSGMNAKQISEYSHQDIPWLTAKEGESIDYEAVFYRTAPYSVRRNGE